MTTIYIAGPMTGYPDLNFPAFFKAAAELTAKGWVVANPADTFGGRKDVPRSLCIRADTGFILASDAMFMLKGWEDSAGAVWEHHFADLLELPIYQASFFSPYPSCPTSPTSPTPEPDAPSTPVPFVTSPRVRAGSTSSPSEP